MSDERLLRTAEVAVLKEWDGDRKRAWLEITGALAELNSRESVEAGDVLVAAEARAQLLRDLDANASDGVAVERAIVQLGVLHHLQVHARHAASPGWVKW